MLTVLFWNVNGRDRAARCAALVRAHAPTLLILAECPDPVGILQALNSATPAVSYQLLPTARSCRVRVFSNLPAAHWPVVEEARRHSVHRLALPSADELLLVSVHLRSRLTTQERELESSLRKLAGRIAEAERLRGHSRTLVIGDFNAHPFQEGMVAADGLHAVMTRRDAGRGARVVERVRSPLFYNPMWRFFGETPAGPPGTHFWHGSGANVSYFWNVLDQCLLRPALLPFFPADGVQILTGDGTMTYQQPDGRPDPDIASDHFPILVRLAYPGV